MEVRLFGELEAVAGGVPVPVRGAKQRALLALLALQRGQPVSADRLIDVLWGDGQAANPANALQAQIGQLRRTLGPAAILTTEAGYALAVGPDQVDVVRFEQLVAKCPIPGSYGLFFHKRQQRARSPTGSSQAVHGCLQQSSGLANRRNHRGS
jgi:two-component SAPR family response regulator